MFKLFLSVFIGGGFGCVSRYAISLLMAKYTTVFPFNTLAVNIIGSFLIGLIWGIPIFSEKSFWIHLLIVGFCGGFTTFSAFSWENLNLIKQGEIFLALVYMTISICLALFATWGGYYIGKNFVH